VAEPEEQEPAGVGKRPGRLAADLEELPVEWFLPPYVPRGMLTVVVGNPGAGKSSLFASLVAQAGFAYFLPGEEDVNRHLLPRLRVHKYAPKSVYILTPEDGVLFPRDRERFIEWCKSDKADLIIFDPVDDYFDGSIDDNSHEHVRRLLRCLADVARETGAAVVICRHPGKDPTNVMAGSRAWGAFPRSIVELVKHEGPPEKRIIRPYKDSMGQDAPARYFDLIGERRQPKVFRLGDVVEQSTLLETKEVPERAELLKIDQAEALLKRLLHKGRMESRSIYAAAEKERLKDRTVGYAAWRLKVVMTREGFGADHHCYWSLPGQSERGSQP
jgi:hypothetical protein